MAALATSGANANRSLVPDILSVEPHPFSAVVKWKVPDAARVVLEVGVDDRYGIWSPTTVAHSALTSRTTLAGLEPATMYRFRIVTRWRNGMTAEARGSFRTDPWPGATAATARPSAAESTATSGSVSPFVLPPPLPPGVTPAQPRHRLPRARFRPERQPSRAPLPSGSTATRSSRAWSGASAPRTIRRPSARASTSSSASPAPARLSSSIGLAGRAMSTVDATHSGHLRSASVGWHLEDEADISVGHAASSHGRREPGVSRSSRSPTTSRSAPHRTRTARRSTRILRQRRRRRVRHLSRRGTLLRRADRQCLLDATRARLAHPRQADLPVDRSRPDGALPRERGSDPGSRPRRDVAGYRGRSARNRLLPGLVGGVDPRRGAPREPRDPRTCPRAPLLRRQGELVDPEPGPHRRTALQRRDVRHRRQHLDQRTRRRRSRFSASAVAHCACSATAERSSRSATSSPTSSPGSVSRSTCPA